MRSNRQYARKNVPEDDLESVPSPYVKHFDEEDVVIEPEDDLQ